jgi:hypothetical protein
MTFPRLAIHTGNTVKPENKHPRWLNTVVIQHNETTATIVKYGPDMTNKAKARHPLLSTFQSNCEAEHWADYNGDFLGNQITNGQPPVTVAVVVPVLREVLETVMPAGGTHHD